MTDLSLKGFALNFRRVAKAIFRDSPDSVIVAFTSGRVSQNLDKCSGFNVSQEIFSCLGSFLFQFLFFFLFHVVFSHFSFVVSTSFDSVCVKIPSYTKTLKCLKISKNVTYLDGSFLSCFSSYSLFTKLFLHFHFPKAMSFLEPKTVNMFHFTGAKQTTPSCPVQLAPDFNPSSAAQSYELSDAVCSKNSRWGVGNIIK